MRDLFPGFYRPSEEEFQRVWQEGMFVLDTNVLLNLYRYPEEARNEFLNVLRNISNRLWIANQVGLEFQQNRIRVIAEQLQKYTEVRKIIGAAESSPWKTRSAPVKEKTLFRIHQLSRFKSSRNRSLILSTWTDKIARPSLQ